MRGLEKKREDADDMWQKMATCVRKVASEVFGVSRGGKQEGKRHLVVERRGAKGY